MVHIGAVEEEHFFVAEVAAGIRLAEGFADEFGDLKIPEAGVGGLKDAGFQDDVRVDFVEFGGCVADGVVPGLLATLRDPGHDGAAHIFNTAVPDHIQALLPVGRIGKMHGAEKAQGHGPGQVIAKDLFADLSVKGKIQAKVCRMGLRIHKRASLLFFSFILQDEWGKVKDGILLEHFGVSAYFQRMVVCRADCR